MDAVGSNNGSTDAITLRLKVMRLVQAALMAGVSFFFGVVVFLYMRGVSQPSNVRPEQALLLLRTLSRVHGIFACAAFLLGPKIAPRLAGLSSPGSSLNLESQTTVEKKLAAFQTTRLVTLAFMKGASFFGLVICLLGVQNGVIGRYPVFWLNAASAVLFLMYGAVTFPQESQLKGLTEL